MSDLKKDPDFIWGMLASRDREAIADEFGSVMAALSAGLRGAITAAPGKVLYVADFSNIESRVLQWVAGDQAALQNFRDGVDPYNDMASFIYKRPINRKIDTVEGMIGKVAVLGLGFQMGASKFVATVKDWTGIDIPEDLNCEHIDLAVSPWPCGTPSAKHRDEDHEFVTSTPDVMTAVKVVDAYRTKNWRVKQLWKDQEEAAIRAVNLADYGRRVRAGKVTWFVEGDFLYCELPSGRRLAYPSPAIVQRETPWGSKRPQLTYMGVDAYTRQWKRQSAYGGLLVENIVQAIARDLMAAAMLRIEETGTYQPVLSVHDEAIAEADAGVGDVHEFEQLMATVPDWGAGCPVTAEGWTGVRYRK